MNRGSKVLLIVAVVGNCVALGLVALVYYIEGLGWRR